METPTSQRPERSAVPDLVTVERSGRKARHNPTLVNSKRFGDIG